MYNSEDEDDNDLSISFEENNNVTSQNSDLYTIYTTEEVVSLMLHMIHELKSVLQIPSVYARLLMNHFKWDQEKLLERYFDGETKKLFLDAQIGDLPSENRTKVRDGCMILCQVCFSYHSMIDMSNMGCSHWFCNECWDGHLNAKITDEVGSDSISCIEPSCMVLVDDSVVLKLLSNPNTKTIYQKLITNSFVEWNKKFRWCSGPNCSFAVKVKTIHFAPRPVNCACGYSFCFQCGEKSHYPTECSLLKKWLNRDIQNFNWMTQNTKKCIFCNTRIEKHGGCNHMTCINCKKEFCWMCMKPYTANPRHACNRYHEQEDKPITTHNFSEERHNHFCARYKIHEESARLEKDLCNKIKMKADNIKETGDLTENQTIFLKKAVEVLCECRSVLMNSYIFAYFVSKCNNLFIFEDNQKDLEAATEKLSGYLEHNLTLENFKDMKLKLLDSYKYCDGRRQVLLNHIYEGYDESWWKFN